VLLKHVEINEQNIFFQVEESKFKLPNETAGNLRTYSAVYSSIWLFLNGSIVIGHLNFKENKKEQQYAESVH